MHFFIENVDLIQRIYSRNTSFEIFLSIMIEDRGMFQKIYSRNMSVGIFLTYHDWEDIIQEINQIWHPLQISNFSCHKCTVLSQTNVWFQNISIADKVQNSPSPGIGFLDAIAIATWHRTIWHQTIWHRTIWHCGQFGTRIIWHRIIWHQDNLARWVRIDNWQPVKEATVNGDVYSHSLDTPRHTSYLSQAPQAVPV